MSSLRAVLPALAALAVGCGNGVGPPTGLVGDTSSSETSVGHSEGGVVTTGAPSGTSTSTGIDATTAPMASSSSTDSDTATTFAPGLDVPRPFECDTFQQNCPPGQKCNWYADDGGSSWNNTKCVPVMEDPAQVDEECFVVDNAVSGIDNCDVGLICWDAYEENIGHCVSYCTGSLEDMTCPPGLLCAAYGDGFSICLGDCDPLLQDCDPSDVCIFNTAQEVFLCVLDGSGDEGQIHDPCEFANSCDAGNVCLDPSAAMECDPQEPGCCEPLCDITLPNTCQGQGQQCIPYFEEGQAPPEFGNENVGFCSLPG
jgi:hypothetical protein